MKTIMVVDDEYIFRDALRDMLDWESIGFSLITEAENGDDALKILRQQAVDIVITDIKMPVIDGIELVRQAAPLWPNIKFVALSGYDEFELVRQAFIGGVEDYIIKNDLSKDQLLRTIRKIVQKCIVKDLVTGQINWLDEDIVPLLAPLSCRKEASFISLLCCDRQKKLPAVRLDQINRPGEIIELADSMTLLQVEKRDEHDSVQALLPKLNYLQQQLETELQSPVTVTVTECSGHFMKAIRQCVAALDQDYTEGVCRVHVFANAVPKSLNPPARERLNQFVQWMREPAAFDPRPATALLISRVEAKGLKPSEVAAFYQSLLRLLKENRPECAHKLAFDIDRERDIEKINAGIIALMQNAQNESFSNPYIGRAVNEYVQKSFADKPSLTQLAEQLNISSEHLSREIVRSFGMPFTQLILNRRMTQVEKLIRETNMKIYEIALAVGYSSYKHFCEAFKKKYGMNPKKFLLMTRTAETRE